MLVPLAGIVAVNMNTSVGTADSLKLYTSQSDPVKLTFHLPVLGGFIDSSLDQCLSKKTSFLMFSSWTRLLSVEYVCAPS